MSGEETPSYELKARRIKQLLSNYYGTDHHQDGDCVSQQSGGVTDDVSSVTSVGTPRFASIDSPAFNPEVYVTTLVRTAKIDTLLKKHGEMVKEIKALDSDMQMLVYENYNKFISATDTIRSMKSNVDGMGEKMEELKEIMGRVAQTSEGVNSKLQTHRDGIEELSRVKSLLEKLQCVIDLPKRMDVALQQGAFSVAVSNYCEARPLLKKYGHQGAFRSVASDCEKVIEDITRKLQERLQDPQQDAEECVRLLRKLGLSQDELQDLFLVARKTQIESSLNEGAAVMSKMADALLVGEHKERTEEDGEASIVSFVKDLNGSVLNLLCQTAASFNSTFSASEQELAGPLDRMNLVSMANAVLHLYSKSVATSLSITAIEGAFEAFSLPAKGIVHFQLSYSEDDKELPVSKIRSNFGAVVIARSLELIGSDLQMVDSRLPEVDPMNLYQQICKTSIEQHLSSCFEAFVHSVIGSLLAIKRRTVKSQVSSGSILRDFGMSNLHKHYANICDLLLRGMTSILDDVKKYENTVSRSGSWNGAFIDVIQGEIQKLFLTLLSAFVSTVSGKESSKTVIFEAVRQGIGSMTLSAFNDKKKLFDLAETEVGPETTKLDGEEIDTVRSRGRGKCPTGVVLLCARLCTFLEINLVPHAVEMLATKFPGAGHGEQPAFKPSDVIRKSNAAATELLRIYIDIYSRSLSVMIRQSIAAANWINHKEPRGPRPICDLIVTRLEAAEKEIVQLIDDGGNRSRRRLSPFGHKRDASSTSIDITDGSEGSTLERNVAKLFKQKVHLGPKADFTQSSIQAAILGGGLKSWIECIRMETLGRAGLQQMQLDVLYLRPLVTGFVRGKENEAINSLIEEVVTAAVDRSIDPTLLEQAVVDKILADNSEQSF